MKGDYIMAAEGKKKKYRIEDASAMVYKNFAGKPDTFNPNGGKRSFGFKITDDATLNMLMDAGFKIKYLSNGDEPDIPYLKVTVKYGDYPPAIWIKSGKSKTKLDADSVKTLDKADIIDAKLVISPYEWEMPNGISGITAYCDALYVTVVPDKFEEEFFADEDEDEEIPFD